jgi:type IVB pilus formation R64 PilN family outer membrane protein
MILNSKKISMVFLAAAISSTVGCKTDFIKSGEATIDDVAANASEYALAVGEPKQKARVISSHDSAWIPAVKVKANKKLASELTTHFLINRSLPSLDLAAERITSITGIAATIQPPHGSSGDEDSDDSGGDDNGIYNAVYSGPLSGFLDALSARYGVFWEYEDGKINFFTHKSQFFVVKSLPGIISSLSDVSPTGESAALKTQIGVTNLDVWSDIESAVDIMLSEEGEAIVSPATGTVMVTDKPDVLKSVEIYINAQNELLTKQVTVNVKVLSVTLNDEDSYGVNWTLVNEHIKKAVGIGFTSGSPLSPGAAGLTLTKLADGFVTKGGEVIESTNRWQGSKLMIEALSKQGNVSLVTSATAMTMNNQPVPIHVGRSKGFLESSESTPNETGAPTVTLTQGTITTGFSMTILPHIQSNGEILLQYALDLSSLIGIFNVESNGALIQAPEIETRRTLQRVRLQSGETIILAGFEDSETKTGQQGVGKSSNTWLGGSVSAKTNKTVFVVLVHPVIVGS